LWVLNEVLNLGESKARHWLLKRVQAALIVLLAPTWETGGGFYQMKVRLA